MQNLIQNSQWCPGPNGGPMYFSGAVATYDNFCVEGNRTCSITQTDGMQGYDQYDPLIPISGGAGIAWGYVLRAVEAEHIILQAAFFDGAGASVGTQQAEIAERVCGDFSRQMAQFTAPYTAAKVQLSLHFAGKVTACTFFAPTAFYC